jgi:hypothetical protein
MYLMSCPHCDKYLTFGVCMHHGAIPFNEQIKTHAKLRNQNSHPKGKPMDLMVVGQFEIS